jgi:hypothetical protein
VLAPGLGEILLAAPHLLLDLAPNRLRGGHAGADLLALARGQRHRRDARQQLALAHRIAVVPLDAHQAARHRRRDDEAVVAARLALVVDGHLHRPGLHRRGVDGQRRRH